MAIIDTTQCRRSVDAHGQPLDEWLVVVDNDVEVLLRGSHAGPDPAALRMANAVLTGLGAVSASAILLLESFMRDEGSWLLGAIDVSSAAEKQDCDFLLEFTLDAKDSPHEYNYSFFSVCFKRSAHNPPPLNRPHPFKFLVEFR